ncbi:hypothetical protein NDU88_000616 [Pleurodeles waltl]|uniref:Uncharacterized protein n=1 Tax=Pleurodeles waltl TaxID=8319 RepID=A0AAV7LAF8_PLEWA|nr:hypothetical protein NDU88_000616 [Pleurodeles waltl]
MKKQRHDGYLLQAGARTICFLARIIGAGWSGRIHSVAWRSPALSFPAESEANNSALHRRRTRQCTPRLWELQEARGGPVSPRSTHSSAQPSLPTLHPASVCCSLPGGRERTTVSPRQQQEQAWWAPARRRRSRVRSVPHNMSLQACTPWDSEEDPEPRRCLVRPKSAKGRNRPPSIQLQGSLQPSTLGCEALTNQSTEEGMEQGASIQSKEGTTQHRTQSQNIWTPKTIDRDMRLGSGRTRGPRASTKAQVTGSCSTLQAKDMNFALPAKVHTKDMNFPVPTKVPCTLNKYSILPSIGCVGERPSRLQAGLCLEDSGA